MHRTRRVVLAYEGLAHQDGAHPGLLQARLDNQGEFLGAFMAEITDPIASAILAQRVEHRGDAVAFTSPAHVWGGVRQADGGWCGMLDLSAGKSILDSVLFEDGGVAVLIHELGPGAGEFSLTYEEYLPDGSPSFTVELPAPFVDGVLPSMGLVQEPGGQESPVIAARQASTAITWIGILDRVSGGVEAFLTSTPVPTPVLDLEVVDAPGSGHAWVVGRRDLGGSEVAEVLEVRTTDDQGSPLPDGPVVERSRAVAFPAGQGFVGFTAGAAFHGAELGEESADRLYLSGTTADSTTGDFAPCWLAWELGSDLAPWVRVAVDVTAPGPTAFTDIVPSPNPGRVMAAATVISSDGSLATALNEFDASTGGQTVAMYYDTTFIAQGLQRAGDGLALQQVDLSTGNAIGQVEWVAGDLWPEFAVELQDGPSDGLVELRNPQGAYWQRALVAGGSAGAGSKRLSSTRCTPGLWVSRSASSAASKGRLTPSSTSLHPRRRSKGAPSCKRCCRRSPMRSPSPFRCATRSNIVARVRARTARPCRKLRPLSFAPRSGASC